MWTGNRMKLDRPDTQAYQANEHLTPVQGLCTTPDTPVSRDASSRPGTRASG